MADPDFDKLGIRLLAFDGEAVQNLRAVNDVLGAKLEALSTAGEAGAAEALRIHRECSDAIGRLRLLDGRPLLKGVRGARWASQYVYAILLCAGDESAAHCFALAATVAFGEYDGISESAVPGIIYFVRHKGTDEIKIGFTMDGNLNARMSALRNAMPHGVEVLTTITGTLRDEAELHKRFGEHRISQGNEWFRSSPELLTFIESIRSGSDLKVPATD